MRNKFSLKIFISRHVLIVSELTFNIKKLKIKPCPHLNFDICYFYGYLYTVHEEDFGFNTDEHYRAKKETILMIVYKGKK